MKSRHKIASLLILAVVAFLPGLVSAHQPEIVTQKPVAVTKPEVSKAYYAKLDGKPDTYSIQADQPFDFYVNVLVPDLPGQKKDVSAIIYKDGSKLVELNGVSYDWKKFFEPFGHDTYWMGPEYKARGEAGYYEILVYSPTNDSKYSLAVGETESFGIKESIHSLFVIPQLKRDFFNESPIDFILSPFGWGYILIMYIIAFVLGLIYRLIIKKVAKSSDRQLPRNIGAPDRWVRAAIGLGLLLLAITTSWNPILLFFSGFAVFEAIFSWCGFYAALGKNTCPL